MAIWLLDIGGATGLAQPAFIQPDTPAYVTDDGTVALAWSESQASGSAPIVYEVRRWPADAAASDEGTLVYEGRDRATFLSGLPEGEYALGIRARVEGGAYPEWSQERLSVTVRYIDSRLVVLLMSLGLATFLATVGSIFAGHRKASKEEASGAVASPD